VATAPEAAPSRGIEAGGFVVQLSAQRSEGEAQAAFRNLQAKYSALSGRDPLIRRKDLGEKGIFFAAQVGPFGVKGDADQLCETLKAAGGACFVQKN
jgi:cell division septation protein DedD